MKKVFIVIPVLYNSEAALPRCLGSTYPTTADYEVIAVEDGSNDGSCGLLQTMDVPHVQLFKKPENKSVNYTRNRGIEQTATEPQLVVPEVVTWCDLDRTDNLIKALRLKNIIAIVGKFHYWQAYRRLYGADLYAFALALYKSKFNHAVLLGIAASKNRKYVH